MAPRDPCQRGAQPLPTAPPVAKDDDCVHSFDAQQTLC
jgi:hypothetical protein